VQRLKEYKDRLVLFPKKANKPKKGDASEAEIADATQLKGDIIAAPKAAGSLSYAAITEVRYVQYADLWMYGCIYTYTNIYTIISYLRKLESWLLDERLTQSTHARNLMYAIQEMKEFKAYDSLRKARANVKLVGIRMKQAQEKEEKEEK
jgi:hypothetical protein